MFLLAVVVFDASFCRGTRQRDFSRVFASSICASLQAQVTRLEQELQQLQEKERLGGFSSSSVPLSSAAAGSSSSTTAAAGIIPGGGSHAEAVDAELAELTRVNSQLRGEMVARSSAWREEKVGGMKEGVVGREFDFLDLYFFFLCVMALFFTGWGVPADLGERQRAVG